MNTDNIREDAVAGEAGLRIVGDVMRMSLQPGDTVVVRLAEMVDDVTAERIRDIVRSAVGAQYNVLVLPKGMNLSVMGPGGT